MPSLPRSNKSEKEQGDINKALLNVMEDLQDTSARDEAILDSIADGVIVVDIGGIIILINRSAERLLGWTADESLGKKWFQIIKLEDEKGNPVPVENSPIDAAIKGKPTSSGVVNSHFYVRKNGTKFPVARTVSTIKIKEKPIGAVSVFRDITRFKEIERMKDEFMDIAAHDLRTPSAAIRGFISRVLDGDAGEISPKARDLLTDAYEGNLRLIRLIDDFLTVSRLERYKIKIVPRPNDLVQLIESSVSALRGIAESKGLTLQYKKVKLPVCMLDKERTLQVINNLIENAIKYTEEGGVTISHVVNKDEVITNITDTGIGISADLQKKLFKKYHKGEESRTRSGLGLGLYISRLCVEGMGGKIWLKSQEGKGSTFSFSLPVAG